MARLDQIYEENMRLRAMLKKSHPDLKMVDSSMGITSFDIMLKSEGKYQDKIQVSVQYGQAARNDGKFIYSVYLVKGGRTVEHKQNLKDAKQVDVEVSKLLKGQKTANAKNVVQAWADSTGRDLPSEYEEYIDGLSDSSSHKRYMINSDKAYAEWLENEYEKSKQKKSTILTQIESLMRHLK